MDTFDDGYLLDTLGERSTGLHGIVSVRMCGVELSVTPGILWSIWETGGAWVWVSISESPAVIDKSPRLVLSPEQERGIFGFVRANVDVLLRRWSDQEMDSADLLEGLQKTGVTSDEEGSR